MNCKNCGEITQGKYCSHCGQNSNVGKITLSSLLQEFSENVLQINRGFFYTLIELFQRPGTRIREYLNGRRKKYVKPITYVLTLSTLYFLVSEINGQNTWMDDLVSGWSAGVSDTGKEEGVPPILTWFSNNFAYATLLLLPVFSLASYIAFRGSGRNYLEHIVINSFITGQQALIYSLFLFIRTFVDLEIIEPFSFLVTFGYAVWVFWQFFREGNRMVNILRSVLTYVLYMIFSLGILFFVMGMSAVLS